MSAIRLNKEEIIYLIQAAMTLEGFRVFYGEKSLTMGYIPNIETIRFAEQLDRENAKSLEARYGEELKLNEFKENDFYDIVWDRYDPVQVIKSCKYYFYQTCEHEGWKDSFAYEFIATLESRIVSRLDGFDKAIWGIPLRNKNLSRLI